MQYELSSGAVLRLAVTVCTSAAVLPRVNASSLDHSRHALGPASTQHSSCLAPGVGVVCFCVAYEGLALALAPAWACAGRLPTRGGRTAPGAGSTSFATAMIVAATTCGRLDKGSLIWLKAGLCSKLHQDRRSPPLSFTCYR